MQKSHSFSFNNLNFRYGWQIFKVWWAWPNSANILLNFEILPNEIRFGLASNWNSWSIFEVDFQRTISDHFTLYRFGWSIEFARSLFAINILILRWVNLQAEVIAFWSPKINISYFIGKLKGKVKAFVNFGVIKNWKIIK